MSTRFPISILVLATKDAHEIPTSSPISMLAAPTILKFVFPEYPIGLAHSAELIRTLFPNLNVPFGL